MQIAEFAHFGGRHGESAALRNILAFQGTVGPSGEPLSEALCFGIAGGIGAGYAWCPAVLRYGAGSGIVLPGRHKAYTTDASWYQGFLDHIGGRARVTETAGRGKAYQNLLAELKTGKPTVVWCSRDRLPFLANISRPCDLNMPSFLVYSVDEAAGEARGGDRAPTPVTLSLDDLADARAGICSHKNRTLTVDAPPVLREPTLRHAAREGIRACLEGMLEPRIKTYGLGSLENGANLLTNAKSKEGWPRIFPGAILYLALRDVYEAIETSGTGGGFYRGLFADFLSEVGGLLKLAPLRECAERYRDLAAQWTRLACAALPEAVKPLRQTRELLAKRCRLYEEQGIKADRQSTGALEKLRKLQAEVMADFPFDAGQSAALLADLGAQLAALFTTEAHAAQQLKLGLMAV